MTLSQKDVCLHDGVARDKFVPGHQMLSHLKGSAMRKTLIGSFFLAIGMLAAQLCSGQAPAGAPAGSNGICNDGSYYNGASKSGACRGHKGVKQWWGAESSKSGKTADSKPSAASAPAPAPAPARAPAAAPTPAPSAAPAQAASSKTSAMTPAPGGGADKVWLNTASNVYHCPGTQWYGKTKAGAYMSEADAKAKGAHSQGNKPCK
jgi:hypothetical protein